MAIKVNSRVSLIAKVLIAVALVAFMVRSGLLDFRVLLGLVTVKNVAMALFLSGMATLGAAWRWIILIRSRGFTTSFIDGFKLYLIGMFFSYALPGAVSGDLVRGYYLIQDNPTRKMDGILSILIDRVLGLYTFFILSLIAVIWDFDFVMSHEHIRWVALLCALIFVGMTLFFTVSFSERLFRLTGFKWLTSHIGPLHKLMDGFQRFGRDRKVIGLSVAMSLVSQLFSLAFFYQVGLMMGIAGVTWKAILFAVPMGFLVTAIPIAPAGIGVGQMAFAYLFNSYMGIESQFGATAISAFQITVAFWALLGAGFYIRRRKPHELDRLEQNMQGSPA